MKKEIKKLYEEDQKAIKSWSKNKITKKEFLKLNKKLQNKIELILSQNKRISGKTYFGIAMIFHHGFKITSSKKALNFAKKAVEKGYSKGKWLIASATDRLLQLQGKPQKFGTPVQNMNSKKLKLYKLDSKTTDEERKEYGLPTLKKLKKYYEIK